MLIGYHLFWHIAGDKMITMDLNRLVNHDVHLFGVELLDAWSVIREFRAYCLNFSFRHGDIFISGESDIDIFTDVNLFKLRKEREDAESNIEVAISMLLRQPRLLKKALRHVWISWNRLHGEVGFNEILVHSVIRTVSYEAMLFIRDNLYGRSSAGSSGDGDSFEKKIQSRWDAQVAAVGDIEKKWLWSLIKYRIWEFSGNRGNAQRRGNVREEVWKKLDDGVAYSGDIGDQLILRDVLKWKETGDFTSIVDHLKNDDAYTDIFELQFIDRRSTGVNISGSEALQLTSELINWANNEYGVEASFDSYPGLGALWRICMKRGRINGYRQWLWQEIKKVISVSLKFQVDIEYYWGSRRYSPLDEHGAKRIRMWILAWAKRHVNADLLCRVLSQEYAYSLFLFLFGPAEARKSSVQILEQCQWIGSPLLEAIGRNPILMIPQAIPLFFDSKHEFQEDDTDEEGFRRHTPGITYTIKPDHVKLVFDDAEGRRRFIDAILKTDPDGEKVWSDQDKDMVEQARKGFQKWLDEGLN